MGSVENCRAVRATGHRDGLGRGASLFVVSACQLDGCSRTAFYRGPATPVDRDAPIIAALTDVVAEETRWGFWECFDRLRALGFPWNHKRAYRVYCALKLNQVRRTKKRVPTRERAPLDAPPRLCDTWAMDFMRNTIYDGRVFHTMNVLHEGNRESLGIEVDTSLPCTHVISVLDQIVALYGARARIRVDNGPEFVAESLRIW